MNARPSDIRRDATIIGLVSFAHGMSHFFQLIVAPLFPFIKDDLEVSYAALGFVFALFYTVSGVFQPLAGFVVDRWGGRAVLIGGTALLAAGTFVAGAAPGYTGLVLGAVVAGLGNSVFHPADFAILNGRVSAQRLGYAYSAHGVLGYLGYAVAPVFSVGVGAAFGWRAALLAGAAFGAATVVLLAANARRLTVDQEPRPASAKPATLAQDASLLLSAPVVMCFLYFTLYASAFAGLQSFGVAAMKEQYEVPATLASGALTAYLVFGAAGIFAGGFIATRTSRHDLVAAGGLALGAAATLLVAASAIPGSLLPAVLAFAGFTVGVTGPSRDLIVRATTPPGATGKVYGFVYSGFDVGSLITPVFYGWLMDRSLPQGVFYVVFGLTLAAILTVLNLPGRSKTGALAATRRT
ncbi:MAG: hypothetical protein A3D95_02935 [Betaproteobacteria bacterium RIFCSPHIGHO2_12_FULL_69_13]|nr:MAG: hypothetical protein A3D95_02935 [Betaproteobacteria bacterium RIFCSPHIGHO2_12_FULL_69_13]OGA66411.1 MAG: hypothetical protein A3G83_18100 [Betaproteobacteria bacterium RIFCSPLOWO2_12_FULL_68_20]